MSEVRITFSIFDVLAPAQVFVSGVAVRLAPMRRAHNALTLESGDASVLGMKRSLEREERARKVTLLARIPGR